MATDNNIQTLRNALFNQLDRLQNPDCNIEKEIPRANALTAVSAQIVATAKIELDCARIAGGRGVSFTPSSFLTAGNEQKLLEDGGSKE